MADSANNESPRFVELELSRLKEQVAGGDPSARRQLFERLSSLVLDGGGGISAYEHDLMDEILVELVDHIETDLRLRMAERLARRETVPRRLVNWLMRDDIRIARPILEQCVALSDYDLIDVIEEKSTAHRQAVARRPWIPVTVSDALVKTDEPVVLVTLLENPGANLSQQATRSLVERSREIELLRAPLLKRKEVTARHAHTMFWWVSSALRNEILKTFKIDEAVLDEVLREAVDAGVDDVLADRKLRAILGRISQRGGKALTEVITALKAVPGSRLTSAFARLMGISEATANKILGDKGGEALAVCCKAVNADREQFTRLFLLIDYKRYGQNRPIGHLSSVSAAYDAMSAQDAQMTLRLWEAQELALAA